MNIDYKVYNYDYSKRDGNLDAEAKGEVKSKKYFPYFYDDGKKMIFKPLSKTKPLSTPFFAYSEVVWSHLLHNFFDSRIPLYHLAKCHGYEDAEPKYHTIGTIVESITKDHERLVNLYEYFMMYPDSHVTPFIEKYINYCLVYYDYTFFYESGFFKSNPQIASEISKQILYSILRGDQNYHYENISFLYEGNNIRNVAASIDHEFSSMFLYIDQDIAHLNIQGKQIRELLDDKLTSMNKRARAFVEMLDEDTKKKFLSSTSINNIEVITKLYPDVVVEFIESLDNMISYLLENPIMLENHSYLEPFNSGDYEIGIERYKKHDEIKATYLEAKTPKVEVDITDVNNYLNQEIVDNADLLKRTLENKISML